MTRSAPRLLVLLLCATALAACASASPDLAKATGGKTAADAEESEMADLAKAPGDLDSNVRQAQLLRTSGQYDKAIKILSQLMLVASDDPRVVGEYGKTLAEQGRASEAVQFLNRASELSPTDWSIFSAMGVAYDQLGDQASARTAYERALTLRPGEPSVLNNYALSRMLANDTATAARNLIARAQIAGGASDPKIARNIALVNELAPAPEAPAAVAYAMPKPAQMASAQPMPLQRQPIIVPAPPVSGIMPTAAPRPLVSQQNLASIPQRPATSSLYAPYQAVVMQPVPVDPLAGPVAVKAKAATHAPRPLAPVADAAKPDTTKAAAKATPAKTAEAKSDAKPAPAKPADAKPVPSKTAKNAVPALRMAADKY